MTYLETDPSKLFFTVLVICLILIVAWAVWWLINPLFYELRHKYLGWRGRLDGQKRVKQRDYTGGGTTSTSRGDVQGQRFEPHGTAMRAGATRMEESKTAQENWNPPANRSARGALHSPAPRWERAKQEPSPREERGPFDLILDKLVTLEDEVRMLREVVEGKLSAGAENRIEHIDYRFERGKPPHSARDPIQFFCDLYNAGVDDSSRQQVFQKEYKTLLIGTANAMKRRRDPLLDPDFQVANNGEYMAVQLDERRPGTYAVFPRFDLTFQESTYGPGAMGEVFDCENFDRRLRYRKVRVMRPALFEFSGQSWCLKDKGILDLGQGEP